MNVSWTESRGFLGSDVASMRVVLLVLFLLLSLSGCGSDPAVSQPGPGQPNPDVGVDVSTDDAFTGDDATVDVGPDTEIVDPPLFNACGGDGELSFDGVVARPSDSCGTCGDGVLVCQDLDTLECAWASEPNECGGCGPLLGESGDSCGCGGVLVCGNDGALSCEAAGRTNECGGCVALAGRPGFECSTNEGAEGWWSCAGADEVRCLAPGQNACGGEAALDGVPGSPCGACGQGVVTCDGVDAVTCEGEELGENACGGCAPLRGLPGFGCGCAGEWACDGTEAVLCADAGRNSCGGCGDLGAGTSIDACSDEDGEYTCFGSDDWRCVEAPTNACGGLLDLNALPGESCGACDDGYVICTSLESTSCVSAQVSNACGGCAMLPGAPGEPCGTGASWSCDGEGALTCDDDGSVNVCGGGDTLTGVPGATCGPCELDFLRCTDPNSLTCSGETPCPELDLTTNDATGVSATAASFHASVDELPIGGATDHGFCWSTSPEPTLNADECHAFGAPAELGTFDFMATSLLPGRVYYVRAWATVATGTEYANDVTFTTTTVAPQNVTATDGTSTEHVTVAWDAIEGATEYRVWRDGELIATVAQASYDDAAAGLPGSVPAPANLAATQGTHTDKVTVTWQGVTTNAGATHTYTVEAVFPEATSAPSDPATGYRGAYSVTSYELSINGGAGIDLGMALSYDDTNAATGTLNAGVATASSGTYTDRVALSVTGASSTQGASRTYEVRALFDGGQGATSAPVTGYRGVGALSYQWQRSSGDSDANYANLAGATSATFDDTSAPANGEGRYYRVAVSAAGAATQISNADRGHRANILTYAYTGGVQSFTVPSQVFSITVEAYGAQGGNGAWGGFAAGARGGYVRATVPVTPGEVVRVYVGGQGGDLGAAGWNGGGQGLQGGSAPRERGGGGGASDIRIGGTGLNQRVLVAGGGGGSCGVTGTGYGGGGGGLIGGNSATSEHYGHGRGGTQITGGQSGYAGTAGSFGLGGSPSSATVSGGGGGWYGGGNGWGGGGGSSYTVPSATGVEHLQGVRSGNGQVTIFW